jgi:hypothetical protein
MLCDRCHGKHLVKVNGQIQPCPECGGMGTLHCCEGLQCQPEPQPSTPAKPARKEEPRD